MTQRSGSGHRSLPGGPGQHFRRGVETDERCSGRSCTALGRPERSASSRSSVDRRNVHRQRRARSETGELAQGGRGGVFREVHRHAGGDDDRRQARIEARRNQLLRPGLARLEVHWHQPQPVGNTEAQLDQPVPLPGFAAGWPFSSTRTCGAASTCTCIARHRATRTAVLTVSSSPADATSS